MLSNARFFADQNSWQRQWRDRVEEADANLQGTVERELIIALTRKIVGSVYQGSEFRLDTLDQGGTPRLISVDQPREWVVGCDDVQPGHARSRQLSGRENGMEMFRGLRA